MLFVHDLKDEQKPAGNPTAQSVPNITRILIDPDIPEVKLFKDR
jgi:hypothetical protein